MTDHQVVEGTDLEMDVSMGCKPYFLWLTVHAHNSPWGWYGGIYKDVAYMVQNMFLEFQDDRMSDYVPRVEDMKLITDAYPRSFEEYSSRKSKNRMLAATRVPPPICELYVETKEFNQCLHHVIGWGTQYYNSMGAGPENVHNVLAEVLAEFGKRVTFPAPRGFSIIQGKAESQTCVQRVNQ